MLGRGAIDAPSESAPSQRLVLASPSAALPACKAASSLNAAKQPAKFDPRFLNICVSVCLCIYPHNFDSPGVKTRSDLRFYSGAVKEIKKLQIKCPISVLWTPNSICRAKQYVPYAKHTGSP